MERVSSKHGSRIDEQQKHEQHALLHGAPDEGRTEARTTEAPVGDEPSMGTRTFPDDLPGTTGPAAGDDPASDEADA
jgi:hypothetical protein